MHKFSAVSFRKSRREHTPTLSLRHHRPPGRHYSPIRRPPCSLNIDFSLLRRPQLPQRQCSCMIKSLLMPSLSLKKVHGPPHSAYFSLFQCGDFLIAALASVAWSPLWAQEMPTEQRSRYHTWGDTFYSREETTRSPQPPSPTSTKSREVKRRPPIGRPNTKKRWSGDLPSN